MSEALSDLQNNTGGPPSNGRRRWYRLTLFVVAPLLLLYVVAMAPAWVHDHHLDNLANRVLAYPLPPGTDFGTYEPQAAVMPGGGHKDMCGYRVRFDLDTYMTAEQILKRYQDANIEPVDGDRPLEIRVWTLSQSSSSWTDDDRQKIIVEVQDNGHDGGGWDIRCW
ncbi:hypothetical protein [Nonomuraea maritima]|uniref:hypothetical protein n=1 Tax=Nonomuraea maritima TaxID=683260 RepID=UPI00115FF051|nr:hypothetical protein [Nonomuraea maritima]